MSKNKFLYPEMVRELKIAERSLSRSLLYMSWNMPSGVAIHISTALEDVRNALKYLGDY